MRQDKQKGGGCFWIPKTTPRLRHVLGMSAQWESWCRPCWTPDADCRGTLTSSSYSAIPREELVVPARFILRSAGGEWGGEKRVPLKFSQGRLKNPSAPGRGGPAPCLPTHPGQSRGSKYRDDPFQAYAEVLLLVGLQLLQGHPGLPDELVVAEFVLVAHRDPGKERTGQPTRVVVRRPIPRWIRPIWPSFLHLVGAPPKTHPLLQRQRTSEFSVACPRL